ncbi:MAG: DUF3450 family protein [Victivallales bacterium]|nr:DUF3450 family protein [Victivallales bacterium]
MAVSLFSVIMIANCLITLFVILFCAICHGADAEACVRLCEELNRIRQGELDARQQWNEQRLAIEGELAAAKASLADSLVSFAETEKKLATSHERLRETEAEIARLKGNLQAFLPPICKLEKALLSRRPALPEPLSKKLAPLFTRMETPCILPEQVPDRLADIIAAYTELSNFAATVTVSTVLLSEDDTVREYDALYLGLTVAYALSRDGSSAAFGEPLEKGWDWKFDPAWRKPIAKALAIAEGKNSAELVSLPLRIREEGTK